MLLRQRQLHYFYVTTTEKLNPTHYDAMSHDFSTLRRKIFDHASYPWEGDNVTLKADLIYFVKNWPNIAEEKSSIGVDASTRLCPIGFAEDDVSDCLRLNTAQIEADEQLQVCRDVIGAGGPEGWVPSDQLYDECKKREAKLKNDALGAAESELERARIREHWMFDDFDEAEYL